MDKRKLSMDTKITQVASQIRHESREAYIRHFQHDQGMLQQQDIQNMYVDAKLCELGAKSNKDFIFLMLDV